jgi:predicted alpha/beta-fold hydrolase
MRNNKSFKPAWWLKNNHLQTIFARYIGRRREIDARKEIFELPDGDFLDCRWVGGNVGPIVVILHGLEGNIESHYAKGMMIKALEQGWRAVLVHFRSCGDDMNRLARGYHSGDTADLQEFMKYLQHKEPNTPMMAVGYSMGGNVLLKWLGESGVNNPLVAAVAVSVPFELHKAADSIGRSMGGRVYENYFLKPMKEKIELKMRMHPNELQYVDLSKLESIRSVREFDEYITAPMYGFKDVMDYYSKSSSRYFLEKIQVPTLIIHAKDDPFMTEDLIPNIDEISPLVSMEVYDRGGHVGFVSGWNPLRPQYWLEQRIPNFMQDQLVAMRRPWRVA